MPVRTAPRVVESILALIFALSLASTTRAEFFAYGIQGEFDDGFIDPVGLAGAQFSARWVLDSNDEQGATMGPGFVQTIYGATSASITLAGTQGGTQDGTYAGSVGKAILISADSPMSSDQISLSLFFLTPPPEQHPVQLIAALEFLGNDYLHGWPLELPPFQPLRVTFYRADFFVSGFDEYYRGLDLPEPDGSSGAITSLLSLVGVSEAVRRVRARRHGPPGRSRIRLARRP